MNAALPRPLLKILAFLAGFHALLAYGLPPMLLAGVLSVFALWCWRTSWQGALTVALSLVVATLLYALILHLSPLERAWYYRPHEALSVWDYAAGHRRYRRNAVVEMRMPHGDLQNLTTRDIAQSRDVVFRTDALGYRNDTEDRCDWLLLGDSFVAGLGDTQSGLIEAWLQRDYGIYACNLGFTGDPADYLIRLKSYRRLTGSAAPVLLFIFEGNDLPQRIDTPEQRTPSAFALFWKRYYRLFSGTDVYRFTGSLVRRAMRSGAVARSEGVIFREVAGRTMAFYARYDELSREGSYHPQASVEQVVSAITRQAAVIFFIPEKTRVYAPLADPGPALPNARWEWLQSLCARERRRCVDLTPALAVAARELADRGEYVWWLDDTHWNAAGMRVAAQVVADTLQSSE